MATYKQIKHMLKNKHTKTVVNWVSDTLTITDILISPIFFHKTHNSMDRTLLIKTLENTLKDQYPNLTIERNGYDSVVIKKN